MTNTLQLNSPTSKNTNCSKYLKMSSGNRRKEKKFIGYIRLKKQAARQQKLKNLGSIIHWVGFSCLIISIMLLIIIFLEGRAAWVEPFDVLVSFMFDGENLGYLNSGGEPGFWIFWLSVTHWPIKLLLTSEKSILPWGKD